jgi:hypothetical protein
VIPLFEPLIVSTEAYRETALRPLSTRSYLDEPVLSHDTAAMTGRSMEALSYGARVALWARSCWEEDR